jgi:hypothetical protein
MSKTPEPFRYDIASLLVEERERIFTPEGLTLFEKCPLREANRRAHEEIRKMLDAPSAKLNLPNALCDRLLYFINGSQRALRTSQLLEQAGVTDRRKGEDALWTLMQQGYIKINSDSTLSSTGAPPKDWLEEIAEKLAKRANRQQAENLRAFEEQQRNRKVTVERHTKECCHNPDRWMITLDGQKYRTRKTRAIAEAAKVLRKAVRLNLV